MIVKANIEPFDPELHLCNASQLQETLHSNYIEYFLFLPTNLSVRVAIFLEDGAYTMP